MTLINYKVIKEALKGSDLSKILKDFRLHTLFCQNNLFTVFLLTFFDPITISIHIH